ncbi:hypothetical protein Tco_0089317 [Tanacetum coccineum]
MFTWMNKADSKLRMIDCFLISDGVLQAHLGMHVTALDRLWSDHNPILLHRKKSDFGPVLFKKFHSWFDRIDFDDIVKEAWSNMSVEEEGSTSIEEKIDARCANNEDRALCVNRLQELDGLEKLESMYLVQMARVKWEVEGDENSKCLHCIINSRRKSQMIQRIMHEGVRITEPNDIKLAFLNFYKEKFNCYDSLVIFPHAGC